MIHKYQSLEVRSVDVDGRDTDAERQEFIRRAAVAIVDKLPSGVPLGEPTWEEVWKCAESLWDAKPEDC